MDPRRPQNGYNPLLVASKIAEGAQSLKLITCYIMGLVNEAETGGMGGLKWQCSVNCRLFSLLYKTNNVII